MKQACALLPFVAPPNAKQTHDVLYYGKALFVYISLDLDRCVLFIMQYCTPPRYPMHLIEPDLLCEQV